MECHRIKTQQELQHAFSIRKEVFVDEQQVPVEEEIDEFDATVDACRHFVACTDDGSPIGAARWREYEPGTAKLQRIAVLQRFRGTGVGKLLVKSMEKDAAQLGYKRSILDAQCSAEGFYRKLGYTTISTKPFLDAGIEHVRMSKDL